MKPGNQSVPFSASRGFTIPFPKMISAVNEIGSEMFQYMAILSLTGLMYALNLRSPVNYLEQHLAEYAEPGNSALSPDQLTPPLFLAYRGGHPLLLGNSALG